MISSHDVAERIKEVAKFRQISLKDLLEKCGINKNAISTMNAGNMINTENIAKIADFLDVPTDFLLGNGVFKNWDAVLRHKEYVVENISYIMNSMSQEILNGLDDLTFARLVEAFKIQIDERNDGIGLSLLTPIPTNPSTENPFETKKASPSALAKDEEKVLKYYRQLTDEEHRDYIKGEMVRLHMAEESDKGDAEFADELAR